MADDISGTAVSTALAHRKNTQFSLDMHSNIEGSSLSPMAGMQHMGQRSVQQLNSLNKRDFDDRSAHREKSKNQPNYKPSGKTSQSNFGGD